MEGHVWGKGEDREVVGTTQTTNVEQLVVEGTGRGERDDSKV